MSKNFVKSYSNEKDIEKVKSFITQTNDLVATKNHNYIQKANEKFHCLTDDVKEIKANSEYIQFEKVENTVNVNTEKLDKRLEYPKYFSSTIELTENNVLNNDNNIFEKEVFTLPVDSNYFIGTVRFEIFVSNEKLKKPISGANNQFFIETIISTDPARLNENPLSLIDEQGKIVEVALGDAKASVILGLYATKVDNTVSYKIVVSADSEHFDSIDVIVKYFDFSLMRFK